MQTTRAVHSGADPAKVAEYHAGVDAEIGRAVAALDTALADLRLQRRRRLAETAAHGREQYEKAQHAQRLARAEAERQAQREAERLERERWARQKEADDARRRSEEQRKQHLEQAARAQKDEAERRAAVEAARKSADAAQAANEAAAKAAADAQQRAKQAPASAPAPNPLAPRPAFGQSPAAASQAVQAAPTAPTAGAKSAAPTKTAAAPAAASAAPQNKADRIGTDWKQVDAEFEAAQARIAWIRENVKMQLRQEPKNVQDRVRDLQSDLRARFGMLTDSKRKLLEVREVVHSHLAEVRDSGNRVAYMAIMNAFAKLLVSQGEAEAQKTIERALPLAMLTILLWDEFRELGDFVVPRFIKKCPQVIGYSCAINTEEGRKRMGWKRDGSTRYETEERYAERIGGICSVWSAMTQTKMSTSKQTLHPYPITHSWIFLARHLNRPKAEVTAADYAAVGAWWDMTATRFYEAFGKQAHKLLTAVWDAWTDDRMEFPALRLRGLGEDWQATGKLEHAWKPLAP